MRNAGKLFIESFLAWNNNGIYMFELLKDPNCRRRSEKN